MAEAIIRSSNTKNFIIKCLKSYEFYIRKCFIITETVRLFSLKLKFPIIMDFIEEIITDDADLNSSMINIVASVKRYGVVKDELSEAKRT